MLKKTSLVMKLLKRLCKTKQIFRRIKLTRSKKIKLRLRISDNLNHKNNKSKKIFQFVILNSLKQLESNSLLIERPEKKTQSPRLSVEEMNTPVVMVQKSLESLIHFRKMPIS